MWFVIVIAVVVGIAVLVGWRMLSNPPAYRNRSEEQGTTVPVRSPSPPSPKEDPGPPTSAGDPAPGSREHRREHGKP